ncbi:MAG: UvrB/UvrC motif-containing protein [Chthoniobacterales bacterium]|nr:UvrB/UvrC motif-containing protein [Chthoniobacterales bacterium]
MLCDVCQKSEASVYYTRIVEGKVQTVNLCESCAKDKGVDESASFTTADLLLGLGATRQIERSQPSQHCPVCGFTQADFKKTGRLGCSACYDTFADGLANLLRGMHKGLKHTGKMPAHLSRRFAMADRVKSLETELKQAVQDEKYEEAARLRDEIQKLEHELQA